MMVYYKIYHHWLRCERRQIRGTSMNREGLASESHLESQKEE